MSTEDVFLSYLRLMRPCPVEYLNTHAPDQCMGPVCCIHNPSDHPMRDFPQQYRFDRRIMERVCPHGVGHPDPDDLRIWLGEEPVLHGCCGCCSGIEYPAPYPEEEA